MPCSGQSAGGVVPICAQGTWNTVPMLTRTARRHSGSQQEGRNEHCVHVQRGSAAEDGAHVGGIHDAFQHSHPAGIPAYLLYCAGRGAAEGAQHAAGQFVAGQAGQHSRSAVYTGASPQRVRMSWAEPVICLRSMSRDSGW